MFLELPTDSGDIPINIHSICFVMPESESSCRLFFGPGLTLLVNLPKDALLALIK